LKQIGLKTSPRTAIFFLSFHHISYIVGSLDVPAVSDEALNNDTYLRQTPV